MDISKIDERLNIPKSIDDTGLVWYNADDEPFKVYGLIRDEDCYRRTPLDVAKATSAKVAALTHNTAGGRVRFSTTSKRIAIRVRMSSVCHMPHMAYTGIHGFDLYADDVFIKSFVPPNEMEGGYESMLPLTEDGMKEILINFPLYNGVVDLMIGLDADSEISYAKEYKYEKPVVFYGSSITQGGCASRPGTCYESVLSRALDFNYINLGFSGSGRAEPAISEYMASLDMSVFVMDYDHNAPSVEYLAETHSRLFNTIREKQPDLPIIMMSRPKYYLTELERQRRDIVEATYIAAIEGGDKNVYYIDGQTLMSPEIRNEGTVDDCHPTDLGFYSMAMRIMPVLKAALEKHE